MVNSANNNLYEIAGRDAHNWLFNATQLKRAADIIRLEIDSAHIAVNHPYGKVPIQDVYLFYSYYLLAGLALENISKGILIGRNPSIVSNGQLNKSLLGGKKSGHDLPDLINRIGISVSQREINLLSRLTEFVAWGKYPIHLKQDKNIEQTLSRSDFAVIDDLFEKFSSVLKSETSPSILHV